MGKRNREIKGKIVREDAKYFYGEVSPGETEGVECPYCDLLFVVLATDNFAHPIKPIPHTGKTNFFCPACGENLKDCEITIANRFN